MILFSSAFLLFNKKMNLYESLALSKGLFFCKLDVDIIYCIVKRKINRLIFYNTTLRLYVINGIVAFPEQIEKGTIVWGGCIW